MLGFRMLQAASQKSSSTFVLDNLTTPAKAAYSLRKLRSAYTGAAINVRRSSDNTTQDIGFTSTGDLDVTSLLSFTGSGSGYVATVYDQSGNGINTSQSTTGNQPRIVLNGVVDALNSKSSMYFLASSSQSLGSTAALASTSGWTASAVARPTTYSGIQSVIDQDNYSTGTRVAQYLRFNGLLNESVAFNTSVSAFVADSPSNSPTVLTSVCTPTSILAYGDGSVGTSAAVSGTLQSASAPFSLGRFTGNGAASFLTGHISEAIVFSAPLSSADRITLIHDQGSYYSVTVV